MQNADVVLDALHSLGMKRMTLQRAYRLLYNPTLYMYVTPGGSDVLRDDLIRTLRQHRFRWGRCTVRDRWLSQVLALILASYLRPRDPDPVHGLRDGSGLHSALRASRPLVANTSWICVLDLYPVLAGSVRRARAWLAPDIADNRFLDLVARYFDVFPTPEPLPRAVLSGTVQPDCLHGLICHQALHPLDTHLGEMYQVFRVSRRTRQTHNSTAGTPSGHSGFVRYLNQILLALPGPRTDSHTALKEITAVLHAQGLDLSRQPLRPVSPQQTSCTFLGYALQRDATRRVSLRMPEPTLKQVCQPFLHRGKPVSLGARTRFSDERIQALYHAEFEAISQYYALAENRQRLRFFRWVLRSSLLRTLAQKHKCHVSDVACRLDTAQATDSGWDAHIPKTQFQAERIRDVQWCDPRQMQAGEPCAVKVARTVRREVVS